MEHRPVAFSEVLRWRIFWRSFFYQSVWNFERMQNAGFLLCLWPCLTRLWKSAADLRSAGLRHLEFFNTQPYMAGFALGFVCRQEEQMAEGRDVPGALHLMNKLKKLLGPSLAGVGDALFWGALRPSCTAALVLVWSCLWWGIGEQPFRPVSSYLSAGGNIPPAAWIAGGVAGYLLAYNLIALWIRWSGLRWGYLWGPLIGVELRNLPWQTWIRGIRWAGFGIAAVAVAVLLVWRWRGAAVCALGFFWMMRARGWSGLNLLLATFVASLAAGLFW